MKNRQKTHKKGGEQKMVSGTPRVFDFAIFRTDEWVLHESPLGRGHRQNVILDVFWSKNDF